MTFYEAALRILEREGKPLDFQEITRRALEENLLSHVGKEPELIMFARLAALSKRKADRKVVPVGPGLFGLVELGAHEDPEALAATPLPPRDETEPPLRPRERHPAPTNDKVRVAGRGERAHRKQQEEERRRLRSLPEQVFELLAEATAPQAALVVAARLREDEKQSEELGAEALLQLLRDDNRRRESQGRRALFLLDAEGRISVDKAGAPTEAAPVDLQAAFARALGVGVEAGATASVESSPRWGQAAARVQQMAREQQRTALKQLRRRLGELGTGALELVVVGLLEATGHRDLRPVRRGREGSTLLARKREGSLEARVVVRLVRTSREVSRNDLQELRKEIALQNAQLGLLIAAGELGRDARTEALLPGAWVQLWTGDALAERMVEKRIGMQVATVDLHDVDETFLRKAREAGDAEDRKRVQAEREAARLAPAPRPESASGSSTEEQPAESAIESTSSEAEPSTEPFQADATPADATSSDTEPQPAPSEPSPEAPRPQDIEVRVDLSREPTAERLAAQLVDIAPAEPVAAPAVEPAAEPVPAPAAPAEEPPAAS